MTRYTPRCGACKGNSRAPTCSKGYLVPCTPPSTIAGHLRAPQAIAGSPDPPRCPVGPGEPPRLDKRGLRLVTRHHVPPSSLVGRLRGSGLVPQSTHHLLGSPRQLLPGERQKNNAWWWEAVEHPSTPEARWLYHRDPGSLGIPCDSPNLPHKSPSRPWFGLRSLPRSSSTYSRAQLCHLRGLETKKSFVGRVRIT